MRKSRFTDAQIVTIINELDAGTTREIAPTHCSDPDQMH
jgi:hypothetical protein